MIPLHSVFSGSTAHRILVMLAASGPMTSVELKTTLDLPSKLHLPNVLAKTKAADLLRFIDGKWQIGETALVVVDRRLRTQRAAMRIVPFDVPALHSTLRSLMDDGSRVLTGDPLRSLADTMDAARAVLQAGRDGKRFKGAEVELLVARELRSITIAADLATATLKQALEVLQ